MKNSQQNKSIKKKIKKIFKERFFLISKTVKIYTNYNWNKFFFDNKYNFQQKPKVKNYILSKKFTWILFLHTIAKKYTKLKEDGKTIKANPCKTLILSNSQFIIKHFSNIIHRIIKYPFRYILYNNIRSLIFIFRKICALTLSIKYQIKTSSAGFKKFENLI